MQNRSASTLSAPMVLAAAPAGRTPITVSPAPPLTTTAAVPSGRVRNVCGARASLV